MADLALQYGSDLSVGPTGDLMLADALALTQQRLLLRLLTGAGDYIWQLSYGAGLGQFVGKPGAPAAIAGVARTQMFLESRVARDPAPSIVATAAGSGVVTLSITYADAATGQTSVLNLTA